MASHGTEVDALLGTAPDTSWETSRALASESGHADDTVEIPGKYSAIDLVRRFLASLEARDLRAAQTYLEPSATMIFPGGTQFRSLDEFVAWAALRYKSVSKSLENYEVIAEGRTDIVYCRGTLSGTWPDGTPFEGIRFLDRFEVTDGKIVRQDVWNDLGEASCGRR